MRIQVFLSIGLLIGFHLVPLRAQDSDWLLWAELEKIMGPLPKIPMVQSGSLSGQADPDVAACVKWRWPHLKDGALAHALEDAEAVSASAAVARLIEGTNVILVRPESQKMIAGWTKELVKADSPEFFKLALIHEIVRYVLDSRYDLAKHRQACQDAEEWYALHALIEGRAQWVTRQIARQLGKEEYFPVLADRYLHVQDQDNDPALRTISQSIVHKRHWAYEKGLAFFEYLETQGIGDVEKQVFSRPPKLTKWIEEPELYVRGLKSQRPDLATILAKLEKVPPPGNWTSTQHAWTPEMILQVGGVLGDQELVKKIAESFPEGRTLIWSDKTNLGRHVALTITRFPNDAAARTYFAFAQKVIQNMDDKQGAKSIIQSVHFPGIKVAVEINRNVLPADSRDIEKTSARVHFQHRVLLAHCGDTVIEITWHNEPGHPSWAEQIIALLLATDR